LCLLLLLLLLLPVPTQWRVHECVDYGKELADAVHELLPEGRSYQRELSAYATQFKTHTTPSKRDDAASDALSKCRAALGKCIIRVTQEKEEGADGNIIKVWRKNIVFVAALAPKVSGKKVVGIWLTRYGHGVLPNLLLSDYAWSICHITEDELQRDEYGTVPLVNTGQGSFWCPEENLSQVDFSNFSHDAHEESLQAARQAAAEAKKRKKEEQDELDRQAFEILRDKLEAEKVNLTVEHKRSRKTLETPLPQVWMDDIDCSD
jgi:hypothetical protein